MKSPEEITPKEIQKFITDISNGSTPSILRNLSYAELYSLYTQEWIAWLAKNEKQ